MNDTNEAPVITISSTTTAANRIHPGLLKINKWHAIVTLENEVHLDSKECMIYCKRDQDSHNTNRLESLLMIYDMEENTLIRENVISSNDHSNNNTHQTAPYNNNNKPLDVRIALQSPASLTVNITFENRIVFSVVSSLLNRVSQQQQQQNNQHVFLVNGEENINNNSNSNHEEDYDSAYKRFINYLKKVRKENLLVNITKGEYDVYEERTTINTMPSYLYLVIGKILSSMPIAHSSDSMENIHTKKRQTHNNNRHSIKYVAVMANTSDLTKILYSFE